MAILYKGIERPEHTPDMIEELRDDEVFVFGSVCKCLHKAAILLGCTAVELRMWLSRSLAL